MRCTDVYRDTKARGCWLPLGHDGPCTARWRPLPPQRGDDEDDDGDAILAAQGRRDDELRRD